MEGDWDDEHREQQSDFNKESQSSLLGGSSWNQTSFYQDHLRSQLDQDATEDRDTFYVPPSSPTTPLFAMQEKLKGFQWQALPSKSSNNHPPSTSDPPSHGSFSTERYFAQAEAFESVDQRTN
jgi:hypothetical protein